ncbi:hypothetical protein FB567DRAFT_605406 [Paraphoma chrysanthemicola]|uniref:BTB domain-containing protein n=1 Tax=Paraphoma chrysanthemicola TaxID=798071 RepID=A0A8K0VW45_9PLEO|nr:hypothetical protein FB567DRAFT_605406 [Paraphoma chrysanthemicola]
MSSNSLQAGSATFIPRQSKLAFAFYPAEVPPPTNTFPSSANDVDVRMFTLGDRQMLATGQRIFICKGNDPVSEIPRPLFLATSTNPSLLVNGRVNLPQNTDAHGVRLLVDYLIAMIFEPSEAIEDLRMSNRRSLYDMLSVTAAADLLGMKKYTDHLYRKCEAYIRRDLPAYEELDAMVRFASNHTRLFHLLVTENLVPRMLTPGSIQDISDFNKYLSKTPVLNEPIQAAITKHYEYTENRARVQQQRQENYQARKREEQAQLQEQSATAQNQERDEKAAKDKKKAEDAEDEKSIQEKVKQSGDKRRFTAREKAHWRRTRGTKLPKGC